MDLYMMSSAFEGLPVALLEDVGLAAGQRDLLLRQDQRIAALIGGERGIGGQQGL